MRHCFDPETLRAFARLAAAAAVCSFVVSVGPARAEAEGAPEFAWQHGPLTAPIGEDLAVVEIPAGYMFLDGEESQKLMEFFENPVSGQEVGTIYRATDDAEWFIIFEWDSIGYVEDEEGADLDAAAILSSIQEGTREANKEREKRGWSTLDIVGWEEPPHYDSETHNLTWAIIGESAGHQNINRTVKLLGRRGAMTATLVSSPELLAAASEDSDVLLAGYRFVSGSSYAEYVPGSDKLAQIGLSALIVGGAGAALVKSGLLARFWKVIVAGIAAIGAGISRVFRSGSKTYQGGAA